MSPADLIARAAADGLIIRPEGVDRLHVKGPAAIRARWVPLIREHKAELLRALSAETRTTWWKVTYHDGREVKVACSPPATRAEVMAFYPEASDAVPHQWPKTRPDRAMTAEEASLIRAWLEAIDERDPECIETVFRQCEEDAEARRFYLGRANEGSA
jgi:DNA polymerase elongation subunit (family B)